jgi:xanthine dehydrogenase accessory factor
MLSLFLAQASQFEFYSRARKAHIMFAMDAVQRALVDALEKQIPAATATVVKTHGSAPRAVGAKMLVYADGKIVGSVGGGEMEKRVIEVAQDAIRQAKPQYLDFNLSKPERGDPMVCGGEMEIFVEPLVTTPTLLIVGAGHVGAACAELGKFLGFRVVVIDDRAEFLTREKFPTTDELRAGDVAQEIQRVEITPLTYVVLVTRAHTLDAALLRAVIDSPAAYIGMLGSQRRVLTVFEILKQEGVSDETLKRVHAPIGIEINAETPQEIAVSIMAEIIAAQRSNA